eukprot:TRINITY_DN9519_c0_g1_i1.p1 TRINITY_DN9519_c0_g1~~TRINITY_DN9519_c0_g1_i1.p1  ORF type:complete len:645 (+),score=256.96 TRINITY_DN9519_c0_g1_i1:50-1984(+)
MANIHDVILIGPPQVGKKTIEKHLQKLSSSKVDSKLIALSNGHSIRIKTMDWKEATSKEEKVIRGMEALVLVFTLENNSLIQARKFLKIFQKKAENFPLLVIANKKDLHSFPSSLRDSFSFLSSFQWLEGSALRPNGKEFLSAFERIISVQDKENSSLPSTPSKRQSIKPNADISKTLKPTNGLLERRSSVFMSKKSEESSKYSTFSAKEKKRKSFSAAFYVQKTLKTEEKKSASPTKESKSNLFVTLQDLLSMIFEETTEDDDFVQVFINTFTTFTTLPTMMEELKETWKSKREEDPASGLLLIKFLMKLMDYIPISTFSDESFLSKLSELVSLLDSDSTPLLIKQIQKKQSKSVEKKDEIPMDPRRRSSSVPQPRKIFSILDLEPKKVAEQLILIDHSLLQDIQMKEFLGLSWTKNDGGKTIKSMIERSNQFSSWIVTEIVKVMDLKKRVSTVRWFIKLGEYSAHYHNYNGLMCVLGALGSASVSRLKKTWSEVGKTYTKSFESLLELMSCTLNYKSYRERLSKSNPAIPFLGVVLSDLIFLDEGNVSYSAEGEINWTKRIFLGRWIAQFEKFQKQNYFFEKDRSLHQFLSILDSFGEEVAYQMSLTAEPRAGARATMERSSIENFDSSCSNLKEDIIGCAS